MDNDIPSAYDPKLIESQWAEFWVKEGLFAPDPRSNKPPYVIVIPPPNVTGSLHMGHALNNTLQDILIRWKKMSGYETLWVPGTDHGGIATQNVVEKLLKQEKKSRYDLGREKFLERMWQWRKESGDTILMQLRRLGCSLDWTRTRFTMDETCSKAVMRAFMEFYKKGWVYRGKRMVNWCVRCRTALSDIEVEYEPRKDKLYHIRYPILSGKKDNWQGVPIVVATTRPETMLGDTAVAVNPKDGRYEQIHGWWVQLPLSEREITVIADNAVDPKFGTGAVKVTPAHDPADFEMGERHHLASIDVIGFDGKMTDAAGTFAGLSREECRKKVIEELQSRDLIEKIEDYTHSVGTCYRCGVTVEPLVSDQWFLKMSAMAQTAAEATRDGRVRIFPDSWTKPYLLWLDNLKDWCLSRQIWWGHRIPVWYCITENSPSSALSGAGHPAARTQCPPIAAVEKPGQCPKCGGVLLEQDPDVLDTWFSSGLWPFSVFGWPDISADLKRFYPTAVLVTGHEILYLWVARMVKMGLEFMKEAPYRQVFIHGIVRDKQGRKMSKSIGNVIDPLIMMEKFGTDALRFVLASQSVPGRDMQIADETFVGARNFANKIWNVSRFALMNVSAFRKQSGGESAVPVSELRGSMELCDRWILSRFQDTVEKVRASLESYNMASAARAIYQFLWDEFCDWYVELSKIRFLSAETDAESQRRKRTALSVLTHILDGVLRLAHPVMPFITEEIWKHLNSRTLASPSKTSLLQTAYPEPDPAWKDAQAESDMAALMECIVKIRTIRAEMNVPPAKTILPVFSVSNDKAGSLVQEHERYVRALCRSGPIQMGAKVSRPAKSAAAVMNGLEIFVPLEGLIDFDKEKQRLAREMDHLAEDMNRLNERLANPDFKTHAPEQEVLKTELRKKENLQKIGRLKEYMDSLSQS